MQKYPNCFGGSFASEGTFKSKCSYFSSVDFSVKRKRLRVLEIYISIKPWSASLPMFRSEAIWYIYTSILALSFHSGVLFLLLSKKSANPSLLVMKRKELFPVHCNSQHLNESKRSYRHEMLHDSSRKKLKNTYSWCLSCLRSSHVMRFHKFWNHCGKVRFSFLQNITTLEAP